MFSVQVKSTPIAESGDYRHRPHPATDDISRLFGAVRIETDLDSLIEKIRRRKSQADFEANRPGMASIILLAHTMGLVSETEIDESVAIGWEAVYRQYQSSIDRITAQLGNEALRIAGENLKHGEFEVLHLSLSRSSFNGAYYLNIDVSPRFSQFSLTEIDVALGRAVAGCLRWIVDQLGMGVIANDLRGGLMMLDDELDEFETSRKNFPDLDHEQLASWFLENDVYPFNEITEDCDYLVDRLGFLESILNDNTKNRFGDLPELPEIRQTVIKWRQSNPGLYRDPWLRFIRQTITVWKWVGRLDRDVEADKGIELCEEENGEVPLDYGHVIGFGFGWEEAWVSQVYDDIANAGEDPMGRIRLEPLAISKTAETLTMLAKSRGLLRLAEVIHYGAEENS